MYNFYKKEYLWIRRTLIFRSTSYKNASYTRVFTACVTQILLNNVQLLYRILVSFEAAKLLDSIRLLFQWSKIFSKKYVLMSSIQ